MKNLILILAVTVFTFSLNAQLVTTGNAISQSCDCYTVTPNSATQAGGIWSPTTIDLSNPFDFTFQVYLGVEDVWGADGIVFVLQQGQNNSGNVAQNLAYSGIAPSLGVEIDTWQNAGAPFNDPAQDHITIYSNGDFTSVLTPSNSLPVNIEDGAFHTFQVTWDPVTQMMVITFDGAVVSAYNGDIINTIFGGNPNVFWGFTGATGGATNLQQVCMTRSAAFSPSANNICLGQPITFTDNSTSDLTEITNYAWNFDDTNTSNTQSPNHTFAASGTYNVALTITDLSGCTNTVIVPVTVLPGLNINVTIPQDISCFGINDGELLATPVNGTAPYTYVWDIPSAAQNPIGLSPNTYNVTVTDNLGCTGTGQGIITEPTQLIFVDTVVTNASCGSANGDVTINVAGGSVNYQYSIDNGVTFSAANTFGGLVSASYSIVVQDANGCQISNTAIVGQTSSFSLDPVTVTDVSCGAGSNDGTISAVVVNGTGNYSYAINGVVDLVTASMSHTFSNLVPGTYNITVTDITGCIVSESGVIVNSATAMTLDNIVPISATCNGSTDGSFEVFITGGDPVIQYSSDGGATFQVNPVFSGLAPNNYNIQVMDGNGCILNGATIVGEPTVLSIDNVTVDSDVACNGGNSGQVTIIASGGNGAYSYSIDGGVTSQASPVFTGLLMGNYTVTLLEGANCFTTNNGTFSIVEPNAMSIDNMIILDVSCNGLTDGSVEIVASGGTPALGYSLDGGPIQASNMFTNLGIGTFTIELSDAANCNVVTQDFTIIESAPLTVSIGNDTTICIGTSAIVCAVPSGGTAPYTYFWNGAPIGVADNCLPPNLTETEMTYTVSITDVNGCTSANTAQQSVDWFDPLSLIVEPGSSICPDEITTLFGSASGGNGGPYIFTWVSDVDGSSLSGQNQTVSPLVTTNYTLTVSDGCTIQNETGMSTVTLYDLPSFDLNISPNTGCSPLVVNMGSEIDQSILANQNWILENGESYSSASSSQTFVEEGCYDLAYNLTTTDGCYTETTLIDAICVFPFPVADFEFSPDDPDLLNLEVDFYNLSIGGTNYVWDLGTGTSSTEANPSLVYPEYGAQDYLVELTVSNDFGCEDAIIKIVHITELQHYYIPNTFTPGDDGVNETFRPIFLPGFMPHDYKIVIMNRWGEIVYETNDMYGEWDGTYGGNSVVDGTYVWQITFRENESDKKHREFGHVNVFN